MNKQETKIEDKNYRDGVAKLLLNKEKKFIKLISRLQECVYEFKNLEDVFKEEREYDEVAEGIDLWHLRPERFHREIKIISNNESRRSILEDLQKLLNMLDINFKQM